MEGKEKKSKTSNNSQEIKIQQVFCDENKKDRCAGIQCYQSDKENQRVSESLGHSQSVLREK